MFTQKDFKDAFRDINQIRYKDRQSERIGFRGFLSMIWNLYQCNRQAKRLDTKFIFTIKLPIKWFK